VAATLTAAPEAIPAEEVPVGEAAALLRPLAVAEAAAQHRPLAAVAAALLRPLTAEAVAVALPGIRPGKSRYG